MQSPVDSFGEAVRVERARRRLTQKQLAELLHLSERTVMSVELARTNSRLETVAILAQGLDISLDAIVFPDKKREYLPTSVSEFFAGKSESEIQKYISLCQYVESMMAEEKGKKYAEPVNLIRKSRHWLCVYGMDFPSASGTNFMLFYSNDF